MLCSLLKYGQLIRGGESNVKVKNGTKSAHRNGEQLKTSFASALLPVIPASHLIYSPSAEIQYCPLFLLDEFVKTPVFVSYVDIAGQKQYGKGLSLPMCRAMRSEIIPDSLLSDAGLGRILTSAP